MAVAGRRSGREAAIRPPDSGSAGTGRTPLRETWSCPRAWGTDRLKDMFNKSSIISFTIMLDVCGHILYHGTAEQREMDHGVARCDENNHDNYVLDNTVSSLYAASDG